jgi:ATP-dependent RNA helicase DDX54/DBP10
VLIVTDLAARGIDIPLLDYVVNYDFPCTPKLFIHRSGRAARAGMPGKCYSLLTPLELPYLVDTALYLGRNWEKDLGTFSEEILRNEHEELRLLKEKINKEDLEKKLQSLMNSQKLYVRTRPSSSASSVKRAKELQYGIHPMFKRANDELEEFTKKLKNFRPSVNILEVSAKLSGNDELVQKIKKNKEKFKKITEHKKALEQKDQEFEDLGQAVIDADITFSHKAELSFADKEDKLESVEDKPKHLKKRRRESEDGQAPTKKIKRGQLNDFKSQSFLSYESTGFFDRDKEISQLTFQAPMDDDMALAPKRQKMVWDNKKKRYVTDDKPKSILKQFKPDHKANKIYKEWTKETKKRIQKTGEQEDPKNLVRKTGYSKHDNTMKSNEEIIKQRKKKISHIQRTKHKAISKQKFKEKNKRKIEKHMRPSRSQAKIKVRR